MAVAGGACTAYRCRLADGELITKTTSALRTYCATPDDALERLGRGESVTVAGSDMVTLRAMLAAQATEDAPAMAMVATLDGYQEEALRTLHPDADVIYLAGKLLCEAAEVAEPLLKLRYHGKPIADDALRDELGDVLWYVATLADALGLSLAEVATANVAKLRARHGATYNAGHYVGGMNGKVEA